MAWSVDNIAAGAQTPRGFAKSGSGTLVAGRPHTWWAIAGFPGAGGYDSTLNGAQQNGNAVAGQIPRTNPASGESRLFRWSGMTTQGGLLVLCDRLWQNRPANATGAQAITFPGLPSRSADATANGDGILAGLEISTASTAGTPTCPITYTNQGNVGSHTANLIDAFTATTAVGSFLRYDLQAGDTGIRSIQSFNASGTLTSGVWNIVLYRILATLELQGMVPNAIDALTAGFPRIFDNTVPFFYLIPNTTTACSVSGAYVETQGYS